MHSELEFLGKRISFLRNKRKLTQEQLAEMSNCSTNHISKLESARTNPSFELLINISRALNIELKDLFYFEEHQSLDYKKNELNGLINKSDNVKIKLLYDIFKSIDNL